MNVHRLRLHNTIVIFVCVLYSVTQLNYTMGSVTRKVSAVKTRHEQFTQVLPGPDPGFGVHFQAFAPQDVLLGRWGQETSLWGQLLCNSPDVVGLKPAAAADETNPYFVSLPGIFVHVPPGENSGFQA